MLCGPGSASWRVIGEPAAIAGGLRALLLQVAHPLAMAGVADHSAFRTDPLGRLHRTSAYVTASTFGSTPEALRRRPAGPARPSPRPRYGARRAALPRRGPTPADLGRRRADLVVPGRPRTWAPRRCGPSRARRIRARAVAHRRAARPRGRRRRPARRPDGQAEPAGGAGGAADVRRRRAAPHVAPNSTRCSTTSRPSWASTTRGGRPCGSCAGRRCRSRSVGRTSCCTAGAVGSLASRERQALGARPARGRRRRPPCCRPGCAARGHAGSNRRVPQRRGSPTAERTTERR